MIGVKEPPWMEMDQWWRLWHRTGHRWIEKLQHEHSDCHQRTYAQLGRSCCQIGLQRDLCEGFEVSRTSVVEMATAPLERSKEGEMVRSAPKTIQHLQEGRHGCWRSFQIHWKCRRSVGICHRQHGLVALCSKLWKLEAVCEMWKEPCVDGPGCLGDPCASGVIGSDSGAAWMAERKS